MTKDVVLQYISSQSVHFILKGSSCDVLAGYMWSKTENLKSYTNICKIILNYTECSCFPNVLICNSEMRVGTQCKQNP